MKLFVTKNEATISSITGQTVGDWVQVGTLVSEITRKMWDGSAWVTPLNRVSPNSPTNPDGEPPTLGDVVDSPIIECPFAIVDPAAAWPSEFVGALNGYCETPQGVRTYIHALPSVSEVTP
jgi:hypothetical protein